MTAASWESKRRGSMFAVSELRDERGVSARDPLSDSKASALPTDEVLPQLGVGLLGRCWSLIWTLYAWTFTLDSIYRTTSYSIQNCEKWLDSLPCNHGHRVDVHLPVINSVMVAVGSVEINAPEEDEKANQGVVREDLRHGLFL